MKIEIIFLILIGIISFALFWNMLSLIFKTIDSKKWTAIRARIQMVDLNTKTDYDKETKEETKSVRLNINYQYDFNGTSFSSDKIYFDKHWILNSNKAKRKNYKRLSKAKVVEAFINPNNPSESTLTRKLSNSVFMYFAMGVFLSFMGLRGIGQLYATELLPTNHDNIAAFLFVSVFVVGILSFYSEKSLDAINVLE